MDRESDRPLLIQFARAPVVGQVKTRMQPHLSPQQACELHAELVLWASAQLVTSGLGATQLSVAGDTSSELFNQCRALGMERIARQRGCDLGERMYLSLRQALQRYQRVVLVGSDCPAIDHSYLAQALAALDHAPVVLGPATDGGYVLIAVRQVWPQLFEGIAWGSAQVYAETVGKLRELGVAWRELPRLADVDRPEDLAAWQLIRDDKAAGA